MRVTGTTYNLQSIPGGASGTRATLALMSGLVKTYKKAPAIRELALSLTSNLPQKSYCAEIKRIHAFVQNNIRYVKDINGVETLQTPIQTLKFLAGDCDDKSTLAAALLEAIGHPTRLVAVGFMPGTYCHVFPETKLGGKWLSVETTEPVNVGWRAPGLRSKMVRNN